MHKYTLDRYSLQVLFFKEPELIYLLRVNWFQALLSNTNNSIQHYSFVYTQLNSLKHYYVILTIQFNTSHLFAHS